MNEFTHGKTHNKMITLQAGKKYITRLRQVVTIETRERIDESPWVFHGSNGHVYTKTGHVLLYADTENDILAEYNEQDAACSTEDAVIALIRKRGKVGRKKYKCSMDRKDLHPDEWIEHHQQELADALQYAERMKGMAKLLHQARDMVMTILHERGWETAEDWVRRYHEQFMPKDEQNNDQTL